MKFKRKITIFSAALCMLFTACGESNNPPEPTPLLRPTQQPAVYNYVEQSKQNTDNKSFCATYKARNNYNKLVVTNGKETYVAFKDCIYIIDGDNVYLHTTAKEYITQLFYCNDMLKKINSRRSIGQAIFQNGLKKNWEMWIHLWLFRSVGSLNIKGRTFIW